MLNPAREKKLREELARLSEFKGSKFSSFQSALSRRISSLKGEQKKCRQRWLERDILINLLEHELRGEQK